MSQENQTVHMETENPEGETSEARKPIPGKHLSKFKAALKLARAIARSEHHIQILAEYIAKNNPPLGLIPKVRPQVPNPPIEFNIIWQDTLFNTALQLTENLHNFWKERNKEVTKTYVKLTTELQSEAEEETWNLMQEIIQEAQNTTTQELKRKKPKPQRTKSITRAFSRRRIDTSNDRA